LVPTFARCWLTWGSFFPHRSSESIALNLESQKKSRIIRIVQLSY
jgi:hypothetical protein